MSKFRKGDRVEAVLDNPSGNEVIMCGWIGTVVTGDQSTYWPPIGVCWDDADPGTDYLHDCDGACEDGYGWYVHEDEIRVLSELKSEDFSVANDDIFAVIGGCL